MLVFESIQMGVLPSVRVAPATRGWLQMLGNVDLLKLMLNSEHFVLGKQWVS
jgi:hypothetical protein